METQQKVNSPKEREEENLHECYHAMIKEQQAILATPKKKIAPALASSDEGSGEFFRNSTEMSSTQYKEIKSSIIIKLNQRIK